MLKAELEAIWRIESPRLIASLARLVRDVGLAEELAQDVFVIALEQWPRSGIPERPGAWLMGAAKHRAVDHIRRRVMSERKHEELGRDLAVREELDASRREERLEEEIDDDLLRLVFTACHPVLPTESRVALTLRVVGGLTTEEIARAFLVPLPTMAQRISRAKRTLSDAHVPFELPAAADRSARLGSVLEVIYLVFNEGYAATAGDDVLRPELCQDAMRIGRVLTGLMPQDAEVHGLVALMELQASRFRARTDAEGEPVLLLDQDRSRWDRLLIQRGLAALARAEAVGAARGPYTLQAAIAACHARANAAAETDWRRMVALYDELLRVTPSPVVSLNRAVAVAMADGPAAGLALIDALRDEPALRRYHLLHVARGDLLERLDRHVEARAEFTRAAAMTRNERERARLLRRAATASPGP
ncbi:MAG TPA: RNA polymerase sigma factor [Candidatus Limnocylindria bacterium]|nr:RNA polymerase sigma factor [Candidatus Limnocylindria bacterium]